MMDGREDGPSPHPYPKRWWIQDCLKCCVWGGGVKFYRGRTTKGFGEMEYLPRERLNLILYYNAEHIEKDLMVVFIPPLPPMGLGSTPMPNPSLYLKKFIVYSIQKTIESYIKRLQILLTYLADLVMQLVFRHNTVLSQATIPFLNYSFE